MALKKRLTKSLYTERWEWLREKLKALRKEQGLTQEQIAERIGRPQSLIAKIESGERKLDVCQFIDYLKILGADPAKVVTGTSRGAHRASANSYLANELGQNADLAMMLNKELGTDVLGHMQSGRGLLNPPGTVWHHPFDDPSVMQLLRTGEHTDPALQSLLHPDGVGGFGNFYGP